MAYFASKVKVNWSPSPDRLIAHAEQIATATLKKFEAEGIVDYEDESQPLFTKRKPSKQLTNLRTLPEENLKLLLTDSISPLPLHKALILLETIREHREKRY